MFSRDEAEKFVKQVFCENNVNKPAAYLAEFCSSDVIAHYKHQIFNVDEIIAHNESVINNTANLSAQIDSLYIINDLIVFWLKQTWFSKEDSQLHEAQNALIFRIKNKLICEIWNLSGWPTGSLNEMTQKFNQETRIFHVDQKARVDFLQRLAIAEKASSKSFDLSDVERDCLYYYFHGYSAKETAAQMGISFRTVQAYIALIKDRFDCATKAQLRKCLFAKAV